MTMNNKHVFQLVAFTCLAVSNGLIFATTSVDNPIINFAWKTAAVLFLIFGLLSWDISRLQPANGKPLKSIFLHYLVVRIVVKMVNPICYFIIKRNSKNFRKLQDTYLLFCLKKNGDTALGRDLGLISVSSREDFLKQCPLHTYPDYEPYVKRIEDNGEERVTINYPVDMILWTSGTTGSKKGFPSNLGQRIPKVGNIPSMAMNHMLQLHVTGNTGLKRILFGAVLGKRKLNKRRIAVGSVTSVTLDEKFRDFFSLLITSPRAVLNVATESECCYLHLLFGLLSKDDVYGINIILGSQAYQFFWIFENNWKQLCDDIELGTIGKHLKILSEIRKELEALMNPNPVLAAIIRVECNKGFKNIVKRIWPHCKCIISITTGAFSIYRTLIQEKYAGDLPIISHQHIGTEGYYGQNLTPLQFPFEFVMDPDSNFVEFIHESKIEEKQPDTVLPEKAVIGDNYEIVITNHHTGLWRYRTGDVVRFKGLWNTVPTYEFNYREGQLLNVFWEKTSESLFCAALTKAVTHWNVCLHDYTTTEYMYWQNEQVTGNYQTDAVDSNRFYVVFLEVGPLEDQRDSGTVVLTEPQKQMLDESLKEVHEAYNYLRQHGSIQPMKLFQVQPGTFSAMREKMLSVNEMASSAQIKIPRVIRNFEYLNFLKNNINAT